ncbi:uncharacterized protein TNCV_4204131 [Trichonephila clavipes]|nr:uncharacterized protein TNCV_4204131 [Trichonephila clavipes]
MAFLLRERKDVLLEVAKELRVEIDITLPKIEFKKRICQSKYYDEESVKCLLEGILEEKREEREKREIKKFEERKLIREFELQRLRAQLSNKLNENKLKAGNRINDLANVCILSGKRTAEVSEPVNKCRPLINPVVNKSVENATSCDFEKKNCDLPVRCTNVSHPSEVRGKEFNVYRNSDCEVKMKVGLCEGRVRTVAMGAQRIDLPGKRDRSTIYRLNLIKLYRRKPELANLVMENSSEGIDSKTLYSVNLFMDFGFQGNLRKSQVYFKLPPDRNSYLRMINAKKKERFLPDPGTIVLRQKDINLVTGKPFRIKTCCSSQMLINSLREDTEYLLDLGVNGWGSQTVLCPLFGEGVVTSSMVVNSLFRFTIGFMVSPAVQGQVPSIVPEFLLSTSCGMTSARGHGAIVYCLNSGSEVRQTGRHNSKVEPGPIDNRRGLS